MFCKFLFPPYGTNRWHTAGSGVLGSPICLTVHRCARGLILWLPCWWPWVPSSECGCLLCVCKATSSALGPALSFPPSVNIIIRATVCQKAVYWTLRKPLHMFLPLSIPASQWVSNYFSYFIGNETDTERRSVDYPVAHWASGRHEEDCLILALLFFMQNLY